MYLGVNKVIYMAFIDLEMAYARIDRDALWQVLRIYRVGEIVYRGTEFLL